MRKRVRLVLIEDDSDDAEAILADIRSNYPAEDRHEFGHNAALILTSDLSSRIVEKLGLDGKDETSGRSGVVVTLATRSSAGYADNAFWDWLNEAEASLVRATP